MIVLENADQIDIEQTRRAWQHFRNTGEIDARTVRPHVARAWTRSRDSGCHPHLMAADVLSSAETSALLARERRLLACAQPFMAAISRSAGSERHAAMLCDRHARVLAVMGDEASISGPEAVPGPGALLSEGAAGANGLSTPLTEERYIELVGPEHFIQGFHAFTCQGIPLKDATGATIGVLGTSVRRLETGARIRNILFCAAQAVECELASQWLSDTVELAMNRDSGLAERLRQDVVQRLAAARLYMDAAANRIARGSSASEALSHIEELIGKFRRQAQVWRDLVTSEACEPTAIELRNLMQDLVSLLDTEARINEISMHWGEAAPLVVLEERSILAQQLLSRLLTAMQRAGCGGRIHVAVTQAPRADMAVVRLTATSQATGNATIIEQMARRVA